MHVSYKTSTSQLMVIVDYFKNKKCIRNTHQKYFSKLVDKIIGLLSDINCYP